MSWIKSIIDADDAKVIAVGIVVIVVAGVLLVLAAGLGVAVAVFEAARSL